MRDKVTLSETCVELAKRAVDNEDEPAATVRGGGFADAVQLAVNMLRIGAEETYRSLETLIEQTPGIREAFDLGNDVPDYSTVCKWYQDFMMEVWRLLLRHRRR